MTHRAQNVHSPRRLLSPEEQLFKVLDDDGVEVVAAVCTSLVRREIDSSQQLVPLSEVLLLRALLDRLRLQHGAVQVSSTTPAQPFGKYPATPDFGLARAGGVASGPPPTALASSEGFVGRCRAVDRSQLGGAKIRLREHFILRNSVAIKNSKTVTKH